jgi:hypothetical protein
MPAALCLRRYQPCGASVLGVGFSFPRNFVETMGLQRQLFFLFFLKAFFSKLPSRFTNALQQTWGF